MWSFAFYCPLEDSHMFRTLLLAESSQHSPAICMGTVASHSGAVYERL